MKKIKENKKTEQNPKILRYRENMTLKDIADAMNLHPATLIQKLISLGQIPNINSKIEIDTAELLAIEFNYQFDIKSEEEKKPEQTKKAEKNIIIDNEKDLVKRAPIITIMGHVDHGKTTLLDTIRKTSVVEGEHGGITQHIGAYQIKKNGEWLTFIDTPGHAAFTEMRARGAGITDIVVLVVAADDGIMPQTIEAIDHAKAAKVPMIVAINKIDKPSAKPDQVKTKLAEIGVVSDEWGGDYQFVEISAKGKQGIDELLDTILIVAELHELKANPNRLADGTVIEAKLDKGKGAVATVIVKGGTLKLGDHILIGTSFGKIRTLTSDRNENLKVAYPAQPVEITGLNEVPEAGGKFICYPDEKSCRQAAQENINKLKLEKNRQVNKELEDNTLNIILKADVKGSIEAINNLLSKINEKVNLTIVSQTVGSPSESDISLAVATNSKIITFNTQVPGSIKKLAGERKIEIKSYNVIYQIEEDIIKELKGMADPEYNDIVIGEAQVRQLFKLPKGQMVAGVYITSGLIKRNSFAKIIRDQKIIHTAKIISLKHLKDDKKEVLQGYEAGVMLDGYNDFKIDDILEIYEVKAVSDENI